MTRQSPMFGAEHWPVKRLIRGHSPNFLLTWLAIFGLGQISHAIQTANQENYPYRKEAEAAVSPLVGLMPKKDLKLYVAVMDHARLSSLDDLLMMKGVSE